ncbi:hypothetical protein [Methylobacter svalbardensis]|uniref:hypothetical protein n=1 Tax=Methylobacter svalbardensis TaxID=3080016 RepID=UPI0030EC6C1E
MLSLLVVELPRHQGEQSIRQILRLKKKAAKEISRFFIVNESHKLLLIYNSVGYLSSLVAGVAVSAGAVVASEAGVGAGIAISPPTVVVGCSLPLSQPLSKARLIMPVVSRIFNFMFTPLI